MFSIKRFFKLITEKPRGRKSKTFLIKNISYKILRKGGQIERINRDNPLIEPEKNYKGRRRNIWQ